MITSTSFKPGQKAALTHGATANGKRKRSYSIWLSMRRRCYYPKDGSWKWYGAKGIKVCDRWLIYKNFVADMGEPPSEIHQIDRIDSDKDYSLENCRWATPSENALNRERHKRENK